MKSGEDKVPVNLIDKVDDTFWVLESEGRLFRAKLVKKSFDFEIGPCDPMERHVIESLDELDQTIVNGKISYDYQLPF